MLLPWPELVSPVLTLSSIALLSILSSPASGQLSSIADGDGFFISYSGTVSASWTPPPNTTCNPTIISSEKNSHLYVGVYPRWDSNPFFFEIEHLLSEGADDKRLRPRQSFSPVKRQYLTSDDLYNLDFASAGVKCEKDGHDCGYFEYNPNFVNLEFLDLKKASVERVPLDGHTGYRVQGDEKTWVANGTADPWFNVYACEAIYFYWYVAKSSPPNAYPNRFPDPHALGTRLALSTTLPHSRISRLPPSTGQGDVTIDFQGNRTKNSTRSQDYELELVTDDPQVPTFRATNGSEITDEGLAEPAPSQTPSPTTSHSPASSPSSVSSPPSSATTSEGNARFSGRLQTHLLSMFFLVVTLIFYG
ncbi:MAG: hypothetical protein Q9167_005034 [Letrouitia subvulpina]